MTGRLRGGLAAGLIFQRPDGTTMDPPLYASAA